MENVKENTEQPLDRLERLLSGLAERKPETPEEESYDLVMVIGNGFDISLGLQTRYADFMKSDWWPFRHRGGDGDYGLGAYLTKRHGIEKWMDVEEQLHKYCAKDHSVVGEYVAMLCSNPDMRKKILDASSSGGKLSEQEIKRQIEIELLHRDKKDYQLLCDHFRNYLNCMEYGRKDKGDDSISGVSAESQAGKLISALSDRVDLLFTFNYTNINRILNHLGSSLVEPDKVVFVHGSLNGCESSSDGESIENSTAILGVDDQRPVLDDYRFMVKQYNRNFYRVNTNTKGRSLTKALKNARNVIFFGLSFGENDFSYFKPFFEGIDTHPKLDSVTVFCYKDEDRMELLERLAKVRNTSSVKYLQFNNDFQIITTGEGDSDRKMDEFIEVLERN